jgi:hypothetical protein
MRYTWSSVVVVAALVVSAAGCSGGGSSKTTTQSGPAAIVTVALDGLMTQNSTLILPTYISHLYGAAPGQDVATITIQNTGSGSTTYVATIDLPSYASAPGTKTITLAAGASKTFTLSPALNLSALFARTTNVPGALDVTVTAGTTTVYQNTTNIQISGRDTVFWSENGVNLAPFVVTMVTPNDFGLEVSSLAHDAGLLFPGGALLGYQAGAAWPSATIANAIAPGTYTEEAFQILAGDRISVAIDAVTNGIGGSDVATVAIMDDANFTTWIGGGSAAACVVDLAAAAGSVETCASPAAGMWHIVYLNPNSNLTSRTITRHRPMGRWETTYEQSRAIFMALRNRGMIYANLPGSGFFSASQNVMYPQESLLVNNANCIEGSLVFDSVWERMGMEPILLVDSAHGHAFTAVRCWTGSSCVIPVETTMVGSTATFDSAYATASATWNAWGSSGDNSATLLDVAAERAAGITPAPM